MAKKKKITPESRTPERGTPVRLKQYEALIFITGAVTLSLEVLASRIMTPYFGVSLYIWAGILSITLIFLALGYQLGGRVSQHRGKEELQLSMLAAPLWAALSIVIATAVYPLVFPFLATINLILASFLGGIILLALPLVVLSAMNPLLIALARDANPEGDAGAGRVFFISTVGSVAGVVLTAFLMIPHLTNFRALLWMSLGLGLVVAGLSLLQEIPESRKKRLLCGCALIVLLSGALLAGQRAYFRMLAGMSDIGKNFEVLAEYTSVFGNIKILAVHPEGEGRKPARAYLQDGIIQNMVTADGVILDHTGFMMRLVEAYAPGAKNSLVLGVAAGMIPRALHRQGGKVTAVEINPNSLAAATEFFDFDSKGIEVHVEDARTFVRRNQRPSYDLVITDLFPGDCIPDYLLTVEFFREVRACLQPGGVVIINTYFDPANEAANETILATVSAVFPYLLELRSPSSAGLVSSACMVAANVPLSPEKAVNLADKGPMSAKDYQTLRAARLVDRARLKNPRPVSDDHNIFSILFASSQLRYRSQFNKLPPNLLVN
ncbi:MAG: fused MFS/spermidine synthase [Deltaproteobacteria bacterium]|nr:fused MFS/spermidine synthase [Deltaproteobacteria bacterium]